MWAQQKRAIRKFCCLIMLGGRCVHCGSQEELQFDHVERTTKEYQIGDLWLGSLEKLLTEIFKCQLLCWPCHIKKSIECGDLIPWGRQRKQYVHA